MLANRTRCISSSAPAKTDAPITGSMLKRTPLSRSASLPTMARLATAPQQARAIPPSEDTLDLIYRRIDTAVARGVAEIKAKLDEKEKIDQQRIKDAQVSWSKFILRRCLEGFLSICIRNLPLIVSMVVPIEVAAGVAGGPIGLAAVTAPILAVALGVLLWQGYLAYREYRALRAMPEGSVATNVTPPAAAAAPVNPTPNAADTPTLFPVPPVSTDLLAPAPASPGTFIAWGPPAPDAPQGNWRHHCVDFARFFMRRGIR